MSYTQSYRAKPENFFGLQFKPLIPFGIVGDKPFDLKIDNFESTVKPIMGYSYGGIVRVGLTELLALETGINYTKRNFRAEYTVADSNVTAVDEIGYVSFDIPVNFLVYIKLGQEFYMNVSGGASVNFNPSNVRSLVNPKSQYLFVFEGLRYSFFDFHANANVGFEYRTRKNGTFYLGISGRIPFKPIIQIATAYQFDTHKVVSKGDIDGATFAFNLKYFFHNNKTKKALNLKEDL
ncbi:hypothetical protein CW751_04345 [Brumimicrobium salinarum]|uniref:Outer membrane protein beta-barrel domain-containing protein n=1 Tax=Brumimicrobium salinarum TaxID=2058658 RepID=A0A2I0R3X6_9FLAO|nr:hypothetical protein CW751_04345 [Brumimicrobium salinarum]